MNRRWLALALLAVTAVIIGALVALEIGRHGQGELWSVKRGTIEGTVEVSGRIVPLNPVPVRSSIDSRVAIVAVTAGDRVQAGEILLVLDSTPVKAELRKAEAQLESAELAVAELDQPDQEVSLVARLMAEQRLRELEAQYERTAKALADIFVLAPVDGVVVELPVTSGSPVGVGSVVTVLAQQDDLGVSVGFDEVDLAYVQPGDRVTVTVDAFPGEAIPGRVLSVAAAAQLAGGITNFPALVALDAQEPLPLRVGMTATVRVTAILRQDVLVIPERAIRAVGQRTFVTVRSERGEEEREVYLGLRSGGLVEVVRGLAEGERVLVRG